MWQERIQEGRQRGIERRGRKILNSGKMIERRIGKHKRGECGRR